MNKIHPLRRFDLAMSLLLRRSSLMTNADISGLPQTEFRSETVRAYVDLLARRVHDWNQWFPQETWPQPEVDVARGTMTFWANARKFRVVLSWGSDGWDLRSQGRLADRRDPLAFAVKWVVSGTIMALPAHVRNDVDLFSRAVSWFVISGGSLSDIVVLHQPLPSGQCAFRMNYTWQHVLRYANGDRLFARALAIPV